MKARWLIAFLGLLIIGSLIFSACAPAVTEEPPEEPAEVEEQPMEEEEPTEEPIEEEAPAATEAPAEEPTEEPMEDEPLGSQFLGVYEGPTIITDVSQFPTEFNEAPELAEMVASGELPPVEERLPIREDLLVYEPLHEIGQYGGTWHRGFTGPGDGWNLLRCCSGIDSLLFQDPETLAPTPNVAKDWEISEDGTEVTVYLRQGLRWSDGEPFTADDIMFWYNDLYMNPEIVANPSSTFTTPSGPGTVEKIDDFTVVFKFMDPYYLFEDYLASGGHAHTGSSGLGFYAPEHYLRQFLPQYAEGGEEAVNKLAQDAGFESWLQLLKDRNTWAKNVDLPVLTPWLIKIPLTEPVSVLERNPYYFAVDTGGNQLPYIDRVELTLYENLETLNLAAIAGEFDLQARHVDVAKLPVFIENMDQGNYTIWFDKGAFGADFELLPTFDYAGDEFLREMINELDFRKALSLGIDRDELNEVYWLGLGVPGSTAPEEGTIYSPGPDSEWRTKWAYYNVDEANALLDGLGLTEHDSEGYRLRPDGERLEIPLYTLGGQFIQFTKIAEMIAQQWKDIGIYAEVIEVERSYSDELYAQRMMPFYIWNNDGSDDLMRKASHVVPMIVENTGKMMEPEEWWDPLWIEMQQMYTDMFTVDRDTRIELGQEIWRMHLENVYAIGTVGLSPASMGVRITSLDMGNVASRMYNSPATKQPSIARPVTFYFKNQ